MGKGPETLPGGLRLDTEGGFPLSTDSMCLGAFCPLFPGDRVADLGSGCGTLGLLLLGRQREITVTGIEQSAAAHEKALANIRRGGLSDRMESILGDLRQAARYLTPGGFDLVVSNPPYFVPGRGQSCPDPDRRAAREGNGCSPEELYAAAARLLPTGGRFCLCGRTEALTELLFWGRRQGLEPKRLQFIRHRASAPAKVLLLECRRGGGPGLKLEPDLILYEENGAPTAQTRRIYGL